MNISEPTTMLTDYLLAGYTLYLAFRLLSIDTPAQLPRKLWGYGFIATAIAAVLGGTSHGFVNYLSLFAQAVIWKSTIYLIGAASCLMLLGIIISAFTGLPATILTSVTIVKFALFGWWMIDHDDFKYVIYDYMPAMLTILVIQIWFLLAGNRKSAKWFVLGILVSFGAAGVQQSGFTIHQHFNHNDLYHVIQLCAMYLLYRGAFLLEIKENSAT